MKKLIILFSVLFAISLRGQVDKSAISPAYLKFLPSNANPQDLRPSDIPSEQVLSQMGLSESEISEALDYKNGLGKYSKSSFDSIYEINALSNFYEKLGDTLVLDSV